MYKDSVTNLDEGDVFAYLDEEPFVDLTDGLDTLTAEELIKIEWLRVVKIQVIGSLLEITWTGKSGMSWTDRIADFVKVAVWEEGD